MEIENDAIVIEEHGLLGHERIEIVHHDMIGHPMIKLAVQCFYRPHNARDLSDCIAAAYYRCDQWELNSLDGYSVAILSVEDGIEWAEKHGCSYIRPLLR